MHRPGRFVLLSVISTFVGGTALADPIAQQAYLKASNTGSIDYFGSSVAVDGETLVVGAVAEDSNATGVNGNQADNTSINAGAAYVFVRGGGIWTQQAYLKASNTGATDQFGASIAVSGDTVVVGAPWEGSSATGINGNQADNSLIRAGAAYVFVRSGTAWSQQAYLKASNTEADDRFGESVAISGNTIVVGTSWEDSIATGVNGDQTNNSVSYAGAAYVLVRNAGVWSQQAYLKASNPGQDDRFGWEVATSGDTAVVTAWLEDSNATGVNGDPINNSAPDAGAAFVFVRSNGVWSPSAYLKASNTGEDDEFGWRVAMSGDTLVVGAEAEDSSATGVNGDQTNDNSPVSGAAYVFAMTSCPSIGDMNCDCVFDFADVAPFVQAQIDPAGYSTTHPGCPILNGDTNSDGLVNGADIQGFVELLIP